MRWCTNTPPRDRPCFISTCFAWPVRLSSRRSAGTRSSPRTRWSSSSGRSGRATGCRPGMCRSTSRTRRGAPHAAFEPAFTLVLEASTYRASVACISRGVVVAEREVATGRSEHEHLMPAVAAVLDEAGIGVSSLARVVCGAGPGSFTSLRIAAALGKGLASGRRGGGPRLASIGSLPLIVAGAAERLAPGPYLASIDALRGERHAALV